MNHSDPDYAGTNGAREAPLRRDNDRLLEQLAVIDDEGWDGPTATALLTYVRSHLVRPLAVRVGLRGTAAAQAEATAWEAVWLQLLEASLRRARSPWGVLWQTARRALLGEILAHRWGAPSRRAWELDEAERRGELRRPLSLEPLLQDGWEPAASEGPGFLEHNWPLSDAIRHASQALVASGWPGEVASHVVETVAAMTDPLGGGATVVGWRSLAEHLDLPPWQARRLTLVLRGSANRPGLLARMLVEGPHVLNDDEVRRGLRSTRERRLPSPYPRPASPSAASREGRRAMARAAS